MPHVTAESPTPFQEYRRSEANVYRRDPIPPLPENKASSTVILVYGLLISVLAHAVFLAVNRAPTSTPPTPVLMASLPKRLPVAAPAPLPEPATLADTVVAAPAIAPKKVAPPPVAKPSPTKKAAAKQKVAAKQKAIQKLTPSKKKPPTLAKKPEPTVEKARPPVVAAPAPATETPPPQKQPLSAAPVVARDVLPEVSRPAPKEARLSVQLPKADGAAHALHGNDLARLTRQLADRLVYPLAAVEAELEGDVVVLVSLKQDGSVFSARVLESSGHLTLDRAAVQAARQLPPLPDYASGEVTLPVSFRLK